MKAWNLLFALFVLLLLPACAEEAVAPPSAHLHASATPLSAEALTP